jgi:hypothetical protein
MDLSTSKNLQNQGCHDEPLAKELCLYSCLADYFNNQYAALARNNCQTVHLATIGITTTNLDSIHSPNLDWGKESCINALFALLVDPS